MRLARSAGCRERFSKASQMLSHLSNDNCMTTFDFPRNRELFHKKNMEQSGLQLYDREADVLECPNCKSKPRGKFKSLVSLFKHAESNTCSLKVRTGPIYDVYSALLSHALYESTVMYMPGELSYDEYMPDYNEYRFFSGDDSDVLE
ncbi:hypothetical protein FLONG3_9560 [Fusarium longipes]|uniref:Uncharacterized protein n=1 Tax=Fusarium longipes TaxID=694270 RepID=A0A395RW74_9HYPO|nr:hypothetical protein FLONG3_9560 [Fusarium longipes]